MTLNPVHFKPGNHFKTLNENFQNPNIDIRLLLQESKCHLQIVVGHFDFVGAYFEASE